MASSSAARRETREQGREGPGTLELGEQIRAWLRVIDAVLVAVEDTAWQAR